MAAAARVFVLVLSLLLLSALSVLSSRDLVKGGLLQSLKRNSTMGDTRLHPDFGGGGVLNNEAAVTDPEEIVSMVHMSIRNSTRRRKLGFFTCGTGNPIDDCWRCDPNWKNNRKRLADCAIGFGRNAIGGRNGRIYVVTDPNDDDPVNPKPGTLRYAVIQEEPLWIIFKHDMVIQLKEELIMNSFKTIDGRGANVLIGNGGACLTLQF
ncbi:hypothetical protein Droror1_Dr00012659, partial [Drosera rotundifolia]